MNANTKVRLKKATGQARFKLLGSSAMVAMALASMSAMAGPGAVCRENNSDPLNFVAHPLGNCLSGQIGTYYANSPKLRKFVDTLPGLTAGNTNTFGAGKPGEYMAVGVADTQTYPGSEYFIIGVVEHKQWMHSDLQNPTTLRGYVQLYPRLSERPTGATNPPAKAVDTLTGQALPDPIALTYPDGTPIVWPNSKSTDYPNGEPVYAYNKPNYLGPIILTMTGTPVRTQMVNLLPVGRALTDAQGKVTLRNGDMFMPVDESLGGAGMTPAGDKYPQNRTAFHLHGGDSPWISDGTPHQWITPAADTATPYKAGSRMMNVPDMPFPGTGSQTIFWPNDQSSRLMWYHDHTFGLTRQNAYGGEAAGYVIMDAAEMALLSGDGTYGIDKKAIPNGLLDQIVLVIQDKTFVPDDIAKQDAKWDTKAWGGFGDLWYPHVYEPFQLWGASAPAAGTDPATVGSNPAGRWDYAVNDGTGMYLPPSVGASRMDPDYGMVAFPDGSYADGTPGKGPSATPESYMDTPVINGVAYPVMNVEPKAYRVRFLNGANDRYFNISLWKAAVSAPVLDPTTGKMTAANTEISIIPFGATAADGTPLNTSNDPAGIPDPSTAGPSIIQFANESGFLPKPVVHKPTLMSFDINGEEIAGDFYLGSAERADTVIDFSQFAGQTIIMYNDGTAPVPGGDARYDYYTGNADQSPFGGAPSTQPGYGPNTRTLMQIRVAATLASGVIPTEADAYDALGTGGALATELPKAYAAVADEHIVSSMPQSVDAAKNQLILADGTPVDLAIKTIHGFTDANIGRLIAQLGTELPDANGASVPTPLSYIDMPTELLHPGEVQYWWIKNYDVDNHPMHFHLFNVQVLAHRLHADGSLRPPIEDEMGWKETVKNWPGEDVIVALKPKTPQLPFGLPNSVRTLDPTMKDGATANDVLYGTTVAGGATKMKDGTNVPFAFNQQELDPSSPNYGGPKAVSNTTFNFGWEYVWHCHILGHEENDLMRPMAFYPVITAAAAPGNVAVDSTGQLSWTDPTPANDVNTKGNPSNEIGFRIERATLTHTGATFTAGAFAALSPTAAVVDPARVNTLANATSFLDKTIVAGTDYSYRVYSVNEFDPTVPTPVSSDVTLLQAPAAVTGLAIAATPAATARALTLAWTDVSNNEDGFSVEASTDGGASWASFSTTLAPNTVSYTATVLPATSYTFRVAVNKAGFASAYTTMAKAYTTPVELLAPVVTALSTLDANGAPQVAVSWTDTSTGETGYTIERCAGTTAACGRAGAVWSLLSASLPAGSTSYLDASAVAGTTYVYRVKALSGATAGPVGSSAQTMAASNVQAPGNLSALSANGANVVLTWTDNSTNETSFTVMRALAGSGNYAALASVTRTATLKLATAGAVTYTDASVVSGVAYDYQVVAVSTVGTTVSNSPASNTATVTPQVPAPTGLSANVAGGTSVVLSWVDSSTNETAFQLTRTDAAGSQVVFTTPARTTTLKTAVGGAVTYTDATAVPLASYSYTVAAVTSAAGVLPVVTGAVSAPVTASLALLAPTAVSAAQTATGITVSWTDNANNDIGYRIVRTGGAVSPTTINVTSTAAQKTATAAARTYMDTTAVAGVSYTYSVATTGGTTAAPVYSAAVTSNAATALVAAPGAPTAVITSASRITLSWTDLSTNETGFLIERSTDGGQNFSTVTTLARTATTTKSANVAVSYVDNLLAPIAQGNYQYRVTAVNQTGTVTNASSAAVVSNLLDFTAPAAPTALVATAGATTTVSLSWVDSAANETGFSVQRATNALFTSGLTTTAVAGATAGTGGTASYLSTGLTKGRVYYFRVAATNLVGASAYSATASITAP